MRLVFCLLLLVACTFVTSAAAESPPEESDLKKFEAAAAWVETLIDWSLLIMGGSIALLLGSTYRRPKARLVRLMYLLFIPGWASLMYSIYCGVQVHRVLLAYHFHIRDTEDTIRQLKILVNNESWWQLGALNISLVCFGAWLVIYLLWWVFNKER